MTIESIETGLDQKLKEVREYIASVAPAEAVAEIEADIERLVVAGIPVTPLKEGGQALDFTLPDVNNQPVTLSELLAKGPVVLAFYRGAWCPYCNVMLRAYQQILPEIQQAGGQLVAVSPQTPDNSLSVAEKNELTFNVLTDQGNRVAREFGLVFSVGEALRPHLTSLGADVPSFNGEDSWELPVPGTYVIGQDGVVRLAFVDPDFRNRLEPAKILEVLRSL